MDGVRDDGDHLWRGGHRIEIEQEPDVFTAILAGDAPPPERLGALPDVTGVKRVQADVVKVTVAPEVRDEVMADLRARDDGTIVHHAYRPKGGEGTRYYLTDQIVVRFHRGVGTDQIDAVVEAEGVRILKAYPVPGTYLVAVTSTAGRNPVKVANSLAERDEVDYAEPNLVNRFQPAYTPVDPGFARQWHLRSQSGPQAVAGADITAPDAWDTTRGHRSVVAAVIDDGFDLSHPDFAGAGKIVSPRDYVDGDTNPFPTSAHGDYHGTPCAGVAIAEENGSGVVGAAPGCAFMPVRFDLRATDDLLWQIFDYVGERADVISCSWGPPPVYAPLPRLLADKFAQLAGTGGPRRKGCVVLFAAGNYNAPLDDPDNVRFGWRHPTRGLVETAGPLLDGNATHPDVLAIAASTSQNRKSAYSNWGRAIALAAPSNNFHPLDRSAWVPGLGIWTTDNELYGQGFTPNSRYTGSFGGTSSATPLAAGVAALVISANPELTGAEVREILTATADKIVDTEPDPVLGLRKGTYDDSGHSDWFGFGKVNAARAVSRARKNAHETTGVVDLVLGRPSEGRLVATGSTQLFRVVVNRRLKVRLDGPGPADFDVYVRWGQPPTPTAFDSAGISQTTDEDVVVDLTEPGEYFVLVRSYRGAGEFEVTAGLE